MTVPLPGHLHTHRERLNELADMGYTDIWSAESDGADAFTPLAMAAAWEPRLRLGTAIVPAYARSPACFAQSVASMADALFGVHRVAHIFPIINRFRFFSEIYLEPAQRAWGSRRLQLR